MLALTTAMIWIALQAQNVSIEIASTKINLAHAAADIDQAAKQLSTLQTDLEKTRKELAEKARQLNQPTKIPEIELPAYSPDKVRESLNQAQQSLQKKD